nr:MAG TPA: hypothetical protein [Caudoviricetes sp.]
MVCLMALMRERLKSLLCTMSDSEIFEIFPYRK